MVFAPVERVGSFETIGYYELLERPSLVGQKSMVDEALPSGELRAYVQPDGDSRFYRVPAAHWTISAPLEGEPGETLWCWSNSDVPANLQNRPLLFFRDEVEEWERGLPEPFDERAWDKAVFDDCLSRAERPRDGYWTTLATLAWIVSRDERFTAATQLFEVEQFVDRGSVYAAAAWMTLDNKAGEVGAQTLSDAEGDLREALESDRLRGGIAIDTSTGESVEIARREWVRWSRSFERNGLVLLPGFHAFRWPSEAVRLAYPAASPASPAIKLTTREQSEAWYKHRVKNWTRDHPPSRPDDQAAGRAVGLKAERVRELRAQFAPEAWKRPGRRIGS